jgi:hypothetical protein
MSSNHSSRRVVAAGILQGVPVTLIAAEEPEALLKAARPCGKR